MAWETIAHRCGHAHDVQLYGPSTQRERKAATLAAKPCPVCQRAAQVTAGAELAAQQDMPALTGSDKQVAWATAIRANAIAAYGPWRATITAHLAAHPEDSETAVWLTEADKVASITSAAWWIDNRPQHGHGLPAGKPADPIVNTSRARALEILDGAQ